MLIATLGVACTKEVIVEVQVQNPVNAQLQNQIEQLQSTISNLSATNLNLESQISLLQSEADLLAADLNESNENAESLMDRLLILEDHIEEYNIEVERAQEESFFRLNFYQARNVRVLRHAGFVMTRLITFDAEGPEAVSWIEDPNYFGLVDGKEISYSTSGTWEEAYEQIRAFYDGDGNLVVTAIARVVDGVYERRDFYVEAYDYIYQFEDAINDYITGN